MKLILKTAEEKIEIARQLNKDVELLMLEYSALLLQVAPFEVERLADYVKTPQQLEFNF